MKLPIETENLIIRRPDLDDADFFLKLLNSSGWLENIGDRGVTTIEHATEYIQRNFTGTPPATFDMFVFEHEQTGLTIGNAGFVDRKGLKGIDLGFAILPEYSGKGFTFEACSALVGYAKGHELEELKAITLPSNIPSIKLLTKLGFKFVKEFYMEEDPELLCLYLLNL